MKWGKKIGIIFLLLAYLLNSNVFSQTLSEINACKNLMKVDKGKATYSYAKNSSNELEFLFTGLFLFYKKFISSQDGGSCTFTPSCSEYGMLAIKHQGVIVGMMNTCDRLMRCNGLSSKKYTLDFKSRLLIDNPFEKKNLMKNSNL